MRLKILSAKCQPSCPGSDELTGYMVCQPGGHYFDYYYGTLSINKINFSKSFEDLAHVDFISSWLIFKRVADIMAGYRGSSSSDGYQVTYPNGWLSTCEQCEHVNMWTMWTCEQCEQLLFHYDDVIMSMMASQITNLTIVYYAFIQAQIKENMKAPRHWPLWGEFTGDRWIPRTKGQ